MKQELRNYESISQTIDAGIEQAKTQIDQSKENLVLAKKIRKNRMEYDVLAKIIGAQPDRQKTTEKLDTLKTELGELENGRRQLQRKLDVRRNDFAVLMRSIKELQAKLDDDVRVDDAASADGTAADGATEADEQMANGSPADDDRRAAAAAGNAIETEPIDDDEDDDLMGAGDVDMLSAENSTETDGSNHHSSGGTPEKTGTVQ